VGLQSPTAQDVGAAWSTVSPGFFDVFNIPIKRGRAFTDRDDAKAPPVVVINEHMAREYWKGRDPLQDRIVIGRGFTMKEFENEPPRQIVGIVGDVRHAGLNSDPAMDLRMYVPQAQLSDAQNSFLLRGGPMAWVMRTQGGARGLVPAIQEQLRRATGLPVSDILSMDQVVSLSTGQQRFNMFLMTVFGASALLLAAIGIYGLMAYTVVQRRHEIGIRLALGADASHVRNMVVRQGMSVALAGVLVGLGMASALSRVLKSQLFGIGDLDPVAFLAIPMVLSVVALMAVWLPANYASRLNPIDSLRSE
jgi:predicted permease